MNDEKNLRPKSFNDRKDLCPCLSEPLNPSEKSKKTYQIPKDNFFGTPCIWNCQKLALNSDNWLYVIGCVWEMFPMSSRETWHEIHGMRVTWVHFSEFGHWTLNEPCTAASNQRYEWMQRTFNFWLFNLRVNINFIGS